MNMAHSNDVFWQIDGQTAPHSGDKKAFGGLHSMYYGVWLDDPLGEFTCPMAVVESVGTGQINLGIGSPQLSFWHMISLVDHRTVGAGFLRSADRGVVQIQTISNAGNSPWTDLPAVQNAYDEQSGTNFFNCMFDPVDDGTTEDDFFDPTDPARSTGPSSTCFPAFSYGCMGSTVNPFDANSICNAGTPPTQADTPDLGDGTWVKTVIDLSAYRGRRARIRYLVTSIKANAETHEEQFFPFNPIPNDDGWWIDDVVISDTLQNPATIVNDQYNLDTCSISGASCIGQCSLGLQDCGPGFPACGVGAGTCVLPCGAGQGTCTGPAQGCGAGCTSVNARIVVETASETLTNPASIETAAPGQVVSFNAADPTDPSVANACLSGTLQFRFCISGDPDGGGPGLPDADCDDDEDETLRGWTENPTYTDAPQTTAAYVTEVRCSTTQNCLDSQLIEVDVACPGKGGSSVNSLGLADIRASESCQGGANAGDTCVDAFDCDSGVCGNAILTWSGEPLAVDTWTSVQMDNSDDLLGYTGTTTNSGVLVTSMVMGANPSSGFFKAYLVKANGPTNHTNTAIERCEETDVSCDITADCPGFFCSTSGAPCVTVNDCPLFADTCDQEECFPVQVEGYFCNSVTWRSGGLAEIPEYPGTPPARDTTLLNP
jgi:hypothetical protein